MKVVRRMMLSGYRLVLPKKCTFVSKYYCSSKSSPQRLPLNLFVQDSNEIKFDEEYDMVVVGSGMASLTSIISANIHNNKNKLNKILLCEKNQDIGGTTAKSGGAMWIPNNHLMKKKFTTDEYLQYLTFDYVNHNKSLLNKSPSQSQSSDFSKRDYQWLKIFVNDTPKIFEQFCNEKIFPDAHCIETFHKKEVFVADYISQLFDPSSNDKIDNPLFNKKCGFGHTLQTGSSYPKLSNIVFTWFENWSNKNADYLISKCHMYNNELNEKSKKSKYHATIKLILRLIMELSVTNAYKDLTKYGFGNDLILNLYQKCNQFKNVTTLKNCNIVGLIWNDNDNDIRCIGGICKISKKGKNKTEEEIKYIRANHGIIFGTGGFGQNQKLIEKHFNFQIFGSCADKNGSNGDFLTLIDHFNQHQSESKKLIKLDNMAKGWFGQQFLDTVILNEQIKNNNNNNTFEETAVGYFSTKWALNGTSMLVVNKHGKRFVNEKFSYHNRVLYANVINSDCTDDNRLSFYIFDKKTADKYPLLLAISSDMNNVIKGDNIDILVNNISQYLNKDSVKSITNNFQIDDKKEFINNLQETISNFNKMASNNLNDNQFKRGEHIFDEQTTLVKSSVSNDNDVKTMSEISKNGEPYYCIVLVSSLLDTKGGPVTNTKSQILFEDDTTVNGLYAVGNCASSFTSHNYYGPGATLSQAFIMGYQAGKYICAI